jgi:predicted DCC family thiol-disulfide oxidoreductase YuxK
MAEIPTPEAPRSAAKADEPPWLFYDGDCGFCQRSVRLMLRLDRGGRFRFAPLGGETFQTLVDASDRASLPVSLVVRTPSGEIETRGRALRAISRLLGGLFWLPWLLLCLTPLSILDWLYDRVAAERHRLGPPPDEACPVPTSEQRGRFAP